MAERDRAKRLRQKAKIVEMYMKHEPISFIAKEVGVSTTDVRNVAEAHELKPMVQEIQERVAREVLIDRVPILREITQVTLTAIKDFVYKLEDKKFRDRFIESVRDLKDLTAIVSDVGSMLRLELGQSTQNVEVKNQMSLEQTVNVLKELSNRDPVFEYPQIEDGKDTITIPERSN